MDLCFTTTDTRKRIFSLVFSSFPLPLSNVHLHELYGSSPQNSDQTWLSLATVIGDIFFVSFHVVPPFHCLMTMEMVNVIIRLHLLMFSSFFKQSLIQPNATTQLKKYVSFLGGSRTQVIRQSIALSLLLGKILKNVSWVSKLGDWYFECSLDSIGYFDKNFDKVKVPTLTQTYFEIESKVGSKNLLGTLHAWQVVNLFNFRAL